MRTVWVFLKFSLILCLYSLFNLKSAFYLHFSYWREIWILITMNSIQAAVLPSNRLTFLQWNSSVAAIYEVSHEEFPTLSALLITLFSYSLDLVEFHSNHSNHLKILKCKELHFKIHIPGCFCLLSGRGLTDFSRFFFQSLIFPR